MESRAPRNPKDLPISEAGEKRRSKGKSGSDGREERGKSRSRQAAVERWTGANWQQSGTIFRKSKHPRSEWGKRVYRSQSNLIIQAVNRGAFSIIRQGAPLMKINRDDKESQRHDFPLAMKSPDLAASGSHRTKTECWGFFELQWTRLASHPGTGYDWESRISQKPLSAFRVTTPLKRAHPRVLFRGVERRGKRRPFSNRSEWSDISAFKLQLLRPICGVMKWLVSLLLGAVRQGQDIWLLVCLGVYLIWLDRCRISWSYLFLTGRR